MAIDEVSEETLDTEPEINVIQHPEQKFPEPLSRTERLLTKMAEIGAQIAENTANPNDLVVHFEFTDTPGWATVDATLAEVQAAHEAGCRVWLEGMMDETVSARAEVTCFVYNGTEMTAWTATIAASSENGPTGIYLAQGSGYAALFNFISAS